VSTLCLSWRYAETRSVNIAWPTSGFGDGDYIYAFQKIIMPIAYEFAPDLVISGSYPCTYELADHQSLLDLTLLKVISLVNAMFLLLLMDT
jgi:hypothetical protein